MSTSRRDQAIANDYLANHMACRVCNTATEREALGTFGGQCGTCYDAWVAERNPRWWPNRPLTADERAKVIAKGRRVLVAMRQQQREPKQWARDLEAREQGGERLSDFQAWAWRVALRQHLDATPVGAEVAA